MAEKRVFEGYVASWSEWEDHDTYLLQEKPAEPTLKEPAYDEISIESEIWKFKSKKVRITIEVLDDD